MSNTELRNLNEERKKEELDGQLRQLKEFQDRRNDVEEVRKKEKSLSSSQKLFAKGWRNASTLPIEQEVPIISIKISLTEEELSPLDSFKKVYSEEVIKDSELEILNSHMSLIRKRINKKQGKKRHFHFASVTAEEVQRCALYEALVSAKSSLGARINLSKSVEKKLHDAWNQKPISPARYKAIKKARKEYSDAELETICTKYTQKWNALYGERRGNLTQFDEGSVPTKGQDARHKMVLMFCKRKPYKNSVWIYKGNSFFFHTLLPAPVSVWPRIGNQTHTPTWFLQQEIKRVMKEYSNKPEPKGSPPIFCCDSGFKGKDVMNIARAEGGHALVSLSSGSSMAKEHEVCSAGLLDKQARWIYHDATEIMVHSSRRSEERCLTIGTTFFHPKGSKIRTEYTSKFRFETALTLSKIPFEELLLLFPDKEIDFATSQEFVQQLTGWDVVLPPPDIFGKQEITKTSLEKMTIENLKILHARTPNISGTTALGALKSKSGKKEAKKKEDLIKEILNYQNPQESSLINLATIPEDFNQNHEVGDLYRLFMGGTDGEGKWILKMYTKEKTKPWRGKIMTHLGANWTYLSWAYREEWLATKTARDHQKTYLQPSEKEREISAREWVLDCTLEFPKKKKGRRQSTSSDIRPTKRQKLHLRKP